MGCVILIIPTELFLVIHHQNIDSIVKAKATGGHKVIN